MYFLKDVRIHLFLKKGGFLGEDKNSIESSLMDLDHHHVTWLSG